MISLKELAIPMTGLPISSSTKPRAFNKDLCGARATPVFKLSLLQLMLISLLLKASTWTAFTTHKKDDSNESS